MLHLKHGLKGLERSSKGVRASVTAPEDPVEETSREPDDTRGLVGAGEAKEDNRDGTGQIADDNDGLRRHIGKAEKGRLTRFKP